MSPGFPRRVRPCVTPKGLPILSLDVLAFPGTRPHRARIPENKSASALSSSTARNYAADLTSESHDVQFSLGKGGKS